MYTDYLLTEVQRRPYFIYSCIDPVFVKQLPPLFADQYKETGEASSPEMAARLALVNNKVLLQDLLKEFGNLLSLLARDEFQYVAADAVSAFRIQDRLAFSCNYGFLLALSCSINLRLCSIW